MNEAKEWRCWMKLKMKKEVKLKDDDWRLKMLNGV